MRVADFEGHPCELVPGADVERPKRPRRLSSLLPSEPVPPEVKAELARMATNPPTPEQIAAHMAHLGLSQT
jgi:hypothetical protein